MMENWQFFLQKEGDYAWLPLETPQVEILEGRYQLIAHTPKSGSSVRVNIRHQYEQENIPQENIQESVRQSDLSGKVEILPLVYLGLGSWSINCYPQVEHSDDSQTLSKQPNFHSLDIQVLPQDFDLFEEWNFEDSAPEHSTCQNDALIPGELELEDLASPDLHSEDGLPSIEANDNSKLWGESIETPVSTTAVSDDVEMPSEGAAISVDHEATVQPEPSRQSRFEPDNLILPTFPTETPTIEFRTVSPKELPRLVSDKPQPESSQPLSPQLPPFAHSQAMAKLRQDQRRQALTKIQLIAAAVSAPNHRCELSRSNRQQKFHSKLSQLVTGTDA